MLGLHTREGKRIVLRGIRMISLTLTTTEMAGGSAGFAGANATSYLREDSEEDVFRAVGLRPLEPWERR